MRVVVFLLLLFVCTSARAQLEDFDYDPYGDLRDKLRARDPNLITTLNRFQVRGVDSIAWFPPPTRALALFLVRDFRSVLRDVRNGLDFHYSMRQRTHPVNRNIKFTSRPAVFVMDGELYSERQQIINDIDVSTLADFEREFLVIYFRSIMLPMTPEELPQLEEGIANYLRVYPNTPYSLYVDRVLNLQFVKSKVGFGTGFHTGLNVPFGNVSRQIPVSLPIGMTMDISYGRFVMKLAGTFTPRFKLKQPTTLNSVEYTRDSTFWSTSFHGSLGMFVVDNAKYRITPFAGIGQKNIQIGKTSDVKMFFIPTFGVDFDWKFAEFNGSANYYEVLSAHKDDTVFYLRTRLCYSPLKYTDARFNGSQYSIVVEVGIFELFARRLK